MKTLVAVAALAALIASPAPSVMTATLTATDAKKAKLARTGFSRKLSCRAGGAAFELIHL